MKKQLLVFVFAVGLVSIGNNINAQDKQKEKSVVTLTKSDQQKKIASIQEQIDLNKNNPKYDMKAKKEELLRYENAVIIEEKKK